jgi:hypothetical protein
LLTLVFFHHITQGGNSGPHNAFMWLMLIIGNGLLFVAYSVEYYARANTAPLSVGLFLDRVVSHTTLV